MELRRQQALELPTAPARRVAAAGLAALAVLAGAGEARAQEPTAPVYDSRGNLVGTPFVPEPARPQLTEEDAIGRALAHEKVDDWLARYPKRTLTEEAELDEDARVWTVKVWSSLPDAGQVALLGRRVHAAHYDSLMPNFSGSNPNLFVLNRLFVRNQSPKRVPQARIS